MDFVYHGGLWSGGYLSCRRQNRTATRFLTNETITIFIVVDFANCRKTWSTNEPRFNKGETWVFFFFIWKIITGKLANSNVNVVKAENKTQKMKNTNPTQERMVRSGTPAPHAKKFQILSTWRTTCTNSQITYDYDMNILDMLRIDTTLIYSEVTWEAMTIATMNWLRFPHRCSWIQVIFGHKTRLEKRCEISPPEEWTSLPRIKIRYWWHS